MPDLQRSDIIKVDLSRQLLRTNAGEILAMGDDCANRFGADLVRNGLPVNVDGCLAIGYFIRPDGYTCMIEGVAEGSQAYVDLPEACYTSEGVFSLAIKLKSDEMNCTLRIIDGYLRRTETGIYVDPGTVVPDIADLLMQIERMEQGTTAASQAAINATNAANSASTAANAASNAAEAANRAANAANESTVMGYANQAKASAEGAAASANAAAASANNAASSASQAQQVLSSKAEKFHATATIGTAWAGSGPYTQSVVVSGLLASDTPIIDLVASTNPETAEAEIAAWAVIYRIDTANGSMTVYASEATTQAITIQILGVR
jgi:hypothetical protein